MAELNVKVGDQVAVGRIRYAHTSGARSEQVLSLATVIRLTRTLIICNGPGGESRYNRNGTSSFKHGNMILRVATADDLQMMADKSKTVADRKAEIQADYDHREQLRALFPEGWRPGISSGLAGDGTHQVDFQGLTEIQIRKLAEVISMYLS